MRNHKSRSLSLPEVVDCRSRRDEAPKYAELLAGDLDWDNPYAWRLEYQAVYDGGVLDSCLKLRAMRGATEVEAIYRLQKLLSGFGVVRVLLWAVRRPMTPAEIEDLRRLNEGVERVKHVGECVERGSQRPEPGPLGRAADEPAGGPAAQLAGLVHSQGAGRGVPGRLVCV